MVLTRILLNINAIKNNLEFTIWCIFIICVVDLLLSNKLLFLWLIIVYLYYPKN